MIFQNTQKSKSSNGNSHILLDITELHFVSGKMVHVIYASRTLHTISCDETLAFSKK